MQYLGFLLPAHAEAGGGRLLNTLQTLRPEMKVDGKT